MIPGAVVFAEGRLAVFARRDRAGYTIYSGRLGRRPAPLPSQHAGVIFPIEKVDPDWACRLQPIIDHYTTASKVGPIRAGLPESLYRRSVGSSASGSGLDQSPWTLVCINRRREAQAASGATMARGPRGSSQLVYQRPHLSDLLSRRIARQPVASEYHRQGGRVSEDGSGERRRRDGSDGQYHGLIHEVGQSHPLRIGLLAAPVYRGDREKKVEQRGGDCQSIESSSCGKIPTVCCLKPWTRLPYRTKTWPL